MGGHFAECGGTWLSKPLAGLQPCPNKYRVQDTMEPTINECRDSMIKLTFDGSHYPVQDQLSNPDAQNKIHERNSEGQTAVHIAIQRNRYLEISPLLIKQVKIILFVQSAPEDFSTVIPSLLL